MKPSHNPDEPIIRSFVEEANPLARAAALQARAMQLRRKAANRLAIAMVILIPAVTIFLLNLPSHKQMVNGLFARNVPASSSAGYVRAYPNTEAALTQPIPIEATAREKQLLTELPELPLLIVRDELGQVTRVEVFER